jgi:hypothetical protein
MTILLLSSRFEKFFDNIEQLSLSSDEFYKLLSSEAITSSDQFRLIEKCSSLISPIYDNSELFRITFYPANVDDYDSKMGFPQISISSLEQLIGSIENIGDKIFLFVGQINHLTKNEILSLLNVIKPELYIGIMEHRRPTFDYSIQLDILAQALKELDVISSYKIITSLLPKRIRFVSKQK